jgi:tRNA1(Val) A37 N6-methylase TrmN6
MKPTDPLKGDDETLDTFYLGRISVLQKKKGYRFSIDAPLLADFIRPEKTDELLEFGTGNGIISLLLSIKPFKHITSIEIQGSLADLARRNVRLNHLEEKIEVLEEDFRDFRPEKKYDVIFSNPPYIAKKKGHLSESQEKSVAKHELKCDIFDIMHKASELLKKKGRSYFIFPEKRKEDFVAAMKKNKLKLNTVRSVYPRKGSDPNLFLAECDFLSDKENRIIPLYLYDENGTYTAEAQEIFSGRNHDTIT